MVEVVGIRFKKAGKIYYFDPGTLDIKDTDFAIVETVRGVEFGRCVIGRKKIKEEDVVSPLKKVIRKAAAENPQTGNERMSTKLMSHPKYRLTSSNSRNSIART